MKAIFIGMLFLIRFGLSQPSLVWIEEYDSGFDDYAQAIAIDYLANSIVTGASYNGIAFDFFTIKYNTVGDTLWTRKFDTGGSDIAKGCAVDNVGNIYIFGSSQLDTLYDYLLIKYDFSGNLVWVRRYQSVFDNFGEAVAVDSNQDVIVTGYSYNGSSYDYLTIKYSSSGDTLWCRRYDAGYNDLAKDIAVDVNNNIVVTGSSYSIADSTFTFLTIKYNAIGDSLWVKRFLSPFYTYNNYANGVAVDSNNIIIIGFTPPFPAIVKYTPIGDTIWTFYFPFIGHGVYEPQDVVIDSNGNIFVIFEYLDVGDEYDYLTAKISPTGDTVWTVEFREGNDGRDAYPRGVVVDFDGNIIVTGFEYDDTTFNYVTVKYSEQGAITELSVPVFSERLRLNAPYPNPFNNRTYLSFESSHAERVIITMCNVAGQSLRTVFNKICECGLNKIHWDGADNNGHQVPAGVYFVHLETQEEHITKKIIRLK